jgi:hypothetical protein
LFSSNRQRKVLLLVLSGLSLFIHKRTRALFDAESHRWRQPLLLLLPQELNHHQSTTPMFLTWCRFLLL